MVTGLLKTFGAAALAASVALVTAPSLAFAHQSGAQAFPHTHEGGGQRVIQGERYIPTIWVDPDGCEHWVMDDGWEGYMTLKVDRNGKPTCHKGSICATMDAHKIFEKNGAWLNKSAKAQMMSFFQSQGATAYKVIGTTGGHHTKLLQKRANMIAQVAHSAGARVVGVDAYGSQNHGWGKQQQRIEILCLR